MRIQKTEGVMVRQRSRAASRAISWCMLAMSALLSVPSHAGPSLYDRYEAIQSAFTALSAEGRIADSDRAAFEKLREAFRNRRHQNVEPLLREIEDRLAAGLGFSDPITIRILPDGSFSGVIDSFPVNPVILRNEIEFVELDPSAIDDMKLYGILNRDTYPSFIAPLNIPVDTAAREYPPAGWTSLVMTKERWERVASVAEASTQILIPGIEPERANADLWLMAATDEGREDALYIKGDVFPALDRYLPWVKMLVIKPEIDTEPASVSRAVWFMTNVRTRSLGLVLPRDFPNAGLLVSGLEGLGPKKRALIFQHSGLTALASDRRFLFTNRSRETVRIDFIAPPAPRMRGERRAEDRRIDGRAAIIVSDGSIESQELLYRTRFSFILPALSVGFVELSIEGE